MSLRIALVYPELLGTYGDGGNALVVAARARRRGISAEIVAVAAGHPLPTGCDIYLLGGGEDSPQTLAAAGLRSNRALSQAVEGGAVCLAVCAGLQILGESYPGAGGHETPGLGLLPVRTARRLPGTSGDLPPRAVGDLVVDAGTELGMLTGYENHGGRTWLLEGAEPLGRVPPEFGDGHATGVGNGTPDRAEGCRVHLGAGLVLATYLHGPVLAQNPQLADLLISTATGSPLAPLELSETAALRAARLRALVPQR